MLNRSNRVRSHSGYNGMPKCNRTRLLRLGPNTNLSALRVRVCVAFSVCCVVSYAHVFFHHQFTARPLYLHAEHIRFDCSEFFQLFARSRSCWWAIHSVLAGALCVCWLRTHPPTLLMIANFKIAICDALCLWRDEPSVHFFQCSAVVRRSGRFENVCNFVDSFRFMKGEIMVAPTLWMGSLLTCNSWEMYGKLEAALESLLFFINQSFKGLITCYRIPRLLHLSG